MTVRDDLPPIFSALVLRPGASDEEIALGIKRPTLLMTTDQCFFRVARQGRPVHSLIAPFAVPSNEILFVMVLRIDGHELRLVEPDAVTSAIDDNVTVVMLKWIGAGR